jgi:hypothetical protein
MTAAIFENILSTIYAVVGLQKRAWRYCERIVLGYKP